jgi:hypothetical protein
MNAIQLAIAKAINAPIKAFNSEAHIKQMAQERQRRLNRQIENRVSKAWSTSGDGRKFSHNLQEMLSQRIQGLFDDLSEDQEAYSYCVDAGVDASDPMKSQRILASFR